MDIELFHYILTAYYLLAHETQTLYIQNVILCDVLS